MRLIWIGMFSMLLAACSSQDDSSESAGEAAAGAGESETPRSVTQDAGRREAVRDRLRELSRDGLEEGVGNGPGQSAQQRPQTERRARDDRRSAPPDRPAVRWWEDDETVAAIGLSDRQVDEIAAARQRLLSAARQSRRKLAEAAADMRSALAEGDRQRLGGLLEQRVAALGARARAEAEWSGRVLEILSDDQMKALAEQHPRVAGSLLTPIR